MALFIVQGLFVDRLAELSRWTGNTDVFSLMGLVFCYCLRWILLFFAGVKVNRNDNENLVALHQNEIDLDFWFS